MVVEPLRLVIFAQRLGTLTLIFAAFGLKRVKFALFWVKGSLLHIQ
jgi:hypothetical protein